MFYKGSIQCCAIILLWRISPRFLEDIGGDHPQFPGEYFLPCEDINQKASWKNCLGKSLCFLDAHPVDGLSRSDAVVVFAFLWSYGDLGNNGHSWPMMMMMRIVMMTTMTALNTWAKSQTSMKEGTNASENVTEVERPSLELEISISISLISS